MTPSESIRCADCGARNPLRAEWCSQCFASLAPAESTTAPAMPDPAPARTPAPTVPPPGYAPDPSAPAVAPLASGGGRYRQSGGTVEWRCVTCDEWNEVGLVACTTCGTSMAGERVTADRQVPDGVEPSEVRLASWLVPGGGQWLLGQKGRAVARVLIGGLFLLGGLVLVVSGVESGPVATVPGLLLLVGSAAIWVLSAIDVRTFLAGGRRELLADRVFLWLVMGVLGAVIASLLLAAIPALGG